MVGIGILEAPFAAAVVYRVGVETEEALGSGEGVYGDEAEAVAVVAGRASRRGLLAAVGPFALIACGRAQRRRVSAPKKCCLDL